MVNFISLIHNDVVSVICKFLQPPDIIKLYKMYPRILPKIEGVFKRRVGEEIDEFFKFTLGEKYLQFRSEMINSDAFLSGSIILQACLGKRWSSDRQNRLDIDLFLRVNPIYEKFYRPNSKAEMKAYREVYTFYNSDEGFKLGYTSLHHFMYNSKDRSAINGYVTHSQYMDEMGKNVILRVNNYVIKEKYIFQVVEINKGKHDTDLDFIDKTVDFNICKNLFRYTDNNNFEVYLGDIKAILHQTAIFNYTGSEIESKDRRDKYIERGFSFDQ